MRRIGVGCILLMLIYFFALTPKMLAETGDTMVTEITLSESNVVLLKGKVFLLKAAVQPTNAKNRKLVWTSTNDAIAVVTNGKVTAKSPGECDIVCEAADGSGVFSKCHITVPRLVQKLSISENKIILPINEKYTPMVTVEPDDATDKSLSWTSSDEKICIVSANGILTAKNPGNCKITARTMDGSKKSLVISVHVPVFDLKSHDYQMFCTDPIGDNTIPIDYHGVASSGMTGLVDDESVLSFVILERGVSIWARKPGRATLTVFRKNDKKDFTSFNVEVFENEAAAASLYDSSVCLGLKVQYNSNVLFSKYNVEVYLDGDMVGTIDNGGTIAWRIPVVQRGKHKIILYKEHDHNLNNSVEFELNDASNILIEISSKRDRIEIVNEEQTLRYITNQGSDNSALWKYDNLYAYLMTLYDYGYYTSWDVSPHRGHRNSSFVYCYLLIGKNNGKCAFLKIKTMKGQPTEVLTYRTGTYEQRGGKTGDWFVYIENSYASINLYDSEKSLKEKSNSVVGNYTLSKMDMMQCCEIYIQYAYPEIYSGYAGACQKLGIK